MILHIHFSCFLFQKYFSKVSFKLILQNCFKEKHNEFELFAPKVSFKSIFQTYLSKLFWRKKQRFPNESQIISFTREIKGFLTSAWIFKKKLATQKIEKKQVEAGETTEFYQWEKYTKNCTSCGKPKGFVLRSAALPKMSKCQRCQNVKKTSKGKISLTWKWQNVKHVRQPLKF